MTLRKLSVPKEAVSRSQTISYHQYPINSLLITGGRRKFKVIKKGARFLKDLFEGVFPVSKIGNIFSTDLTQDLITIYRMY
jgi:hypothetical protein